MRAKSCCHGRFGKVPAPRWAGEHTASGCTSSYRRSTNKDVDTSGGFPQCYLRYYLSRTVSLYRVHLKWKEKDITLRARGLDLTHPYFVSITDLVFDEGDKLIIDPTEDEVRRTFGEADHLMIPFQTVTLIEEIKDERPRSEDKVRNFTVVQGDDAGPAPEDDSSSKEPDGPAED